MEKNKGITLIALVITIIVLLILAGVSIATLTGENGVLTKASEAEKETDITDTKEQIKIELMGKLDDKKTNYTNTDVKVAVKKITGKDVEENTPIVQSIKGNNVDISDLWVVKKRFYIEFYDGENLEKRESFEFKEGMDFSLWIKSEYAEGISNLSTMEVYPGGMQIRRYSFDYEGSDYEVEMTLMDADGNITNEDDITDNKVFCAYK